jgi:hypothetical protein
MKLYTNTEAMPSTSNPNKKADNTKVYAKGKTNPGTDPKGKDVMKGKSGDTTVDKGNVRVTTQDIQNLDYAMNEKYIPKASEQTDMDDEAALLNVALPGNNVSERGERDKKWRRRNNADMSRYMVDIAYL